MRSFNFIFVGSWQMAIFHGFSRVLDKKTFTNVVKRGGLVKLFSDRTLRIKMMS